MLSFNLQRVDENYAEPEEETIVGLFLLNANLDSAIEDHQVAPIPKNKNKRSKLKKPSDAIPSCENDRRRNRDMFKMMSHEEQDD